MPDSGDRGIRSSSGNESLVSTNFAGPGIRSWSFRIYVAALAISNAGTSATLFLVPLIVLNLSGSAVSVGLTAAVEMLPYLLFGLPVGVWVDRASRRFVLLGSSLLSGVVLFMLAMTHWLGFLNLAVILVSAFALSVLTIFFNSAEFAILPTFIPNIELTRANGILSASTSTASILGPIFAGLVMTIVDPESALLIDSASFFILTLAIIGIYRDLPGRLVRKSASSVYKDLVSGVVFVANDKILGSVAILLALTNLLVGSTVERQVFVLAKSHFHASNWEVSVLVASTGVGVVAASLFAGQIRARCTLRAAILGPMFVGSVCIFLTGYSPIFPLSVFSWSVGAGAGATFVIALRTLRQEITPVAMLGRVVTVSQVIAWSAIPVGALWGGWLVSEWGSARVFMVLGGIQVAISTVFLLWSPLGRIDEILSGLPSSNQITGVRLKS
ncbi:MAG: MFS transporter [Gordonia sp. (in: high G+C Gram-positive bacteria)]